MPCSPTSRISFSGSVRRHPDPSTGRPSPAPLTPPLCAAADYTTLKQCQRDFDLARIRQAIREIGLTLAELDMDPQAYLTRSFCILELLATVESGTPLLVQMHYLRAFGVALDLACLLYTSPSPRDRQKSRMPSSA